MLRGVYGSFARNDDAVLFPPTLRRAREWLSYSVEGENAVHLKFRRLRRTCRLVVACEHFDALEVEGGVGMHLDIEPITHVLIALLGKGGQRGGLEV
jgi:hypothetical protein